MFMKTYIQFSYFNRQLPMTLYHPLSPIVDPMEGPELRRYDD